MKICSKCGIEKTIEEFNRNKNRKDGLVCQCRNCQKEYYEINKEKIKESSKRWRENNPEKAKENYKRWCENNLEKEKESSKRWRENNPERTKELHKRWYENNPVLVSLRNRLQKVFKLYSKTGKCGSSKKYGIDYQAIIEHLGLCPGDRNEYHIDHIRPLCSFDFDDLEQIKQAFAPENHQWLTAEENLKKGKKHYG